VSADFHRLVIVDVVHETDDARSFFLKVPEDLRTVFAYRSGQFLTIGAPGQNEGLHRRCYSLSSVHGCDADLKITVKRVPLDPVSNWMIDNLKPDDRLAVMRPAGLFTSRWPDRNLALFAAGSGITPIISLAKDRLRSHASASVFLFYANRDERSVIFRTELAALAQEFPARFRVIHWLDSVQGLPSQTQITGHASGLESSEYFICGPSPFMDAVSAALSGLGIEKDLVHLERFVLASPGEPTIDRSPAARSDAATNGGNASLTVVLDGQATTIDWNIGELMLDALQAAGLNPPYSCRSGSCGACICTLESGEVEMRHNEVLDEADLGEGLVLACQSVARSSHIKVSF
jgi:3-ketosteroid 9alpha-monooxygenase subunit B